jgi:hypothetical protein
MAPVTYEWTQRSGGTFSIPVPAKQQVNPTTEITDQVQTPLKTDPKPPSK